MTKPTIFLSYSRPDKRWKDRISGHLKVLGKFEVWSDEDIVSGENWFAAIQEAINQAQVAIFVVSSDFLNTPFIAEHEIPRFLGRRQTEGLFVIPVIARPCAWDQVDWLSKLQCYPEKGRALSLGKEADIDEDLAGLARKVGKLLAKPLDFARPPYIGIKPFGDEDADLFYGREALAERLVDRLGKQSLLAVVGPSGSGKSSLVRVGLFPKLRQGAISGSQTWELIVFRPGDEPLKNLIFSLLTYLTSSEGVRSDDIKAFEKAMIDDAQALAAKLQAASAPPMLLVVDQFEEIFTRTSSEEHRFAFLRNVLNAALNSRERISIVLVIRADFFDRIMDYPEIAAQLETSQIIVSIMSEGELWQAIVRPAERAGLRFEAGLVDQILNAMRGQKAGAGALPLLQQALLELWKRREGKTLTNAAYNAIGGVNGAISSWADSVYLGLTSEKQIVARELLVNLVQTSNGSKYTRIRVPPSELIRDSGRALQAEVLNSLIDSRLLTADYDLLIDEKQVEIAHEALFYEWPRLNEWLSQARDSQWIKNYVQERTKFWNRVHRDSGSLLRGAELIKIDQWSKEHPEKITPSIRAYLDESLGVRTEENRSRRRSGLGKEVLERSPIQAIESPLRLQELHWHPDRSPPGSLLRAEFEVVPFHFRKYEIDDLTSWCCSGESLGIRLYTAAGGMGKTRLALEICRRMQAEGWQAGFVDREQPPGRTWRKLVQVGGPRLLVVDYAETQRNILVPLLREIDRAEKDQPIRVLLLARAALDWWEQLRTEGDGVGELLSGPVTSWFTLQPLAPSLEERAESHSIAAEAFSSWFGNQVPDQLPGDLHAEHFNRVLLLHMSALAIIIDGVGATGEDGLLDYVLDRERRLWSQLANEWELPGEMVLGIGRAMAAFTLGGGVDDEKKALLALRGLSFFHDEKESTLIRVAWLLHKTYSGENLWIAPIMPDLLGEQLVQREMEVDGEELLDLVLGGPASDQDLDQGEITAAT